MKALITLNGLPQIDKPQSILNVEYDDEKQLISKLKDLQSGYSLSGRDKPEISTMELPSKKYPGKKRKVIDCSTYADWHHVAHVNVSSPNVPSLNLSSL